LELSNQANGFKEQPASLSIKTCPESGVGNILTGESATDDINALKVVASTLSNVALSMHVGPMFGEDSACIVINFYLPLANHPATLET
jgi:hypothetical protein